MKEAINVELNKKESLERIELCWDNNGDILEYTKEENVLEKLRPHIYLKGLVIECYHGSKSPSWMNNEHLPSLKSYHLKECCRMEVLPPLGTFLHLEIVELSKLNSLKQIDSHFYGSGVYDPFPCLKHLELNENGNLEKWEEFCGDKCGFAKIQQIAMIQCPNLMRIPPLPSSLQSLIIFGVGLTSLTMIKSNMDKGAKEGLTTSTACMSLINMPLSNMKYLDLSDCDKLGYVGMGVLGNKLEKILLHNCPKLSCDSLDDIKKGAVEFLPSLKKLRISDCPKLIPSSLLHGGVCSSLEELEIRGFHGFDSSLTISCLAKLTKLVNLCLDDCPNIPSINRDMPCRVNFTVPCQDEGGDPDEMFLGCFISLKTLQVTSCPHLLRCLVPAATNDTIKCGPIQMAALTKLELDDADIDDEWLQVFLSAPQSFPSQITNLKLRRCHNIKSLPEDMLSRLTRLAVMEIGHCERLATIGLGGFQALDSLELEIRACPVLAAAAPSSLHKIKISHLTVAKCSVKLLTQLLAHCSVTNRLCINCIPELTFFDGDLEEAFLGQKSLTALTLATCDNLQYLPTEIARLSSLYFLRVFYCLKLQHLPDLRQLTSLCRLDIIDCPELKKRYPQEQGGNDWENIAHIPQVSIR